MSTLLHTRQVPHKWLIVTALAVAAIALLWWAQDLYAPEAVVPSRTVLVGPGDAAPGAGTIGPPMSPPVVPAVSADRFRVVGVVAMGAAVRGSSASDSEGVALIAVGGLPPRSFRIGSRVEGETFLLEVSAFGATLGPRDGSATMSLQVAPAPASEAMATRATGVIPSSQASDEAPTMSEEVWRSSGSKHPPLRLQTAPAPQIAVDNPAEASDGRWKPSGAP